jgi:hypothetical protein
MELASVGLIIWFVTGAVLWYQLPRGGKTHRFVATEFKPHVAVAFGTAIAVGFCLIFLGVVD